jgi:hypothetical protein
MTRVEIMEFARKHELALEAFRTSDVKRRHNKIRYFDYDYGAPIKSFEALHEYVKWTGKLK